MQENTIFQDSNVTSILKNKDREKGNQGSLGWFRDLSLVRLVETYSKLIGLFHSKGTVLLVEVFTGTETLCDTLTDNREF